MAGEVKGVIFFKIPDTALRVGFWPSRQLGGDAFARVPSSGIYILQYSICAVFYKRSKISA